MPGCRHEAVESLRAQIARIEQRPALSEAASRQRRLSGPFALPGGLLHEVFTDERRNGGAALGFALAQARVLAGPERPALLFVQLRREAQDMGLPYGVGLKSFGIDPDALVLTRVESIVEFLWAIEEAVSCRAVAAVLADIANAPGALDFTASRRLSLRAQAAGTSVFLTRYGKGREASAARLRWRVAPALSGAVAFDARAPGAPRWRVVLEKGRLPAGRAGTEFFLDWTENGFVVVDSSTHEASPEAGRAPSPRAVPAALGDRLPQAG
ncbi:ImuA family protein [Devosia sp.]|uniref:ImuA family protein n=1 Tax=Devosia sp. TaxID=1871048 RepID=UPI002F1059FF